MFFLPTRQITQYHVNFPSDLTRDDSVLIFEADRNKLLMFSMILHVMNQGMRAFVTCQLRSSMTDMRQKFL